MEDRFVPPGPRIREKKGAEKKGKGAKWGEEVSRGKGG